MDYSIIIPTYNRAYILGSSIESAIAQNGNHDYEILVIDDGSSDNTKMLCDEYVDTYSNIRYLSYEKNKGVGYARNYGVKYAQGGWVLFLDSDDALTPDALDLVDAKCEEYPEILDFMFSARNSEGNITTYMPNDNYVMDAMEDFYRKKFDGEFCNVIKRDLMLEFPFVEGCNGFEGITWYQIEQKYHKRILMTYDIIRYNNTTTTDSLLRSKITDKSLQNQLTGMRVRLDVMEENLRRYQKRGKDGLSQSYATIAKVLCQLGRKSESVKYTAKAFLTDPFEPRVYRNIMLLCGLIK